MNGKVGTVGILGAFRVNSYSHRTNPDGDWLLGILRNFSYLPRFRTIKRGSIVHPSSFKPSDGRTSIAIKGISDE